MTDMRRLNLRSTAFHEAGHAVFAVAQGIRFSRVWLLRRSDDDPVPQNQPLGQLTRVTPLNKPDFVGRLEEAKVEAVQAFVGPVAECLAYPGWQPDFNINASDFIDARGVLRFQTVKPPIDLALAQIDEEVVREHGIVPWGVESLATSADDIERDVLFVHGYPGEKSKWVPIVKGSIHSSSMPFWTSDGVSDWNQFDEERHIAIMYPKDGWLTIDHGEPSLLPLFTTDFSAAWTVFESITVRRDWMSTFDEVAA